MGFFSNTIGAIGNVLGGATASLSDVVEDLGTTILGPSGTRGTRIGNLAGTYLESTGIAPRGTALALGTIGQGISNDIEGAEGRGGEILRNISQAPITEQDYLNLQRGGEVMTAGVSGRSNDNGTGTVIDIFTPKPVDMALTGVELGMDFIEQISDYFAGGDENLSQQNMMCKPASARSYTINPQTGCISITRKQQAKLKELVRMVGINVASKQIGLPTSLVGDLLLKTFRTRRRGISGADLRTVKRVDRQMHSLACALGGISTTSRAVAARKSPPKRSC